MTEARIRAKILRYLNSLQYSDFHVSPPGSHTGKPDITGCLCSIHVGIEVKQPGLEPTKIQEYRIKKIREAGGVAFCAHSVEEVRENAGILAILWWLQHRANKTKTILEVLIRLTQNLGGTR